MAKKLIASAVRARVLRDFVLDGVAYHCDQIIEADAAVIAQHADALDAHPDAVAYCMTHHLGLVFVHPSAARADSRA
jgi:hypothetical protein